MKKLLSLLVNMYAFLLFIKPVRAVDLGNEFAFGGITSLGQGVTFLVKPAFQIATLAVIFYFIIGATRLVLSGGDKNAVAAAREMITHAIIGFILLILMFVLINYIPQFLGLENFSII